ncbi:MAG: T9SS type A sorting domain-containing protein [Bacteroidota bacterium]|nr:T9SS type A sorting domain-containing protein [Bacteroidota bacterium]
MNNDPVELQILNSKGQQVYLERFSNKKGENRISFTDGAALNADVYIVRIMQRGTILNTSKVIKK